ncbi:MAG: hypothetical protein K9L22_03790 [Methylococcaceae bacterium]|nr:hypothetical protein [Methylococcaceae bacterium]
MHLLSDKELYEAITYARNINETDGQAIVTNFHLEQPALAETIFNIFPAIIAEKNQDMGNFYMELCFDALCVYQHAFGSAIPQTEDWLVAQMESLSVDLLAFNKDKNKAPEKSVVQAKFANILKESIDDYASESSARVPFIEMTQSMTLAMLSLLESLYKKESNTLH